MSKIKIKILHNRILVLPDSKETKTMAGIILPNDSAPPPNTGTVISVGDKVQDIKPGDSIIHNRGCGIDIQYEGTRYIIMKDIEVLMAGVK